MKHRIQLIVTVIAGLMMCSMIAASSLTAGTITSTATGGNWNVGATWGGGVVPGASDDVVIANGATVTINTNVTVASVTVGQGASGTLTFDKVAARIMVVKGNVTVASGGTFIAETPVTTTGDLGALSTTITNVASTTGVVVGMSIGGASGIAAGTTVSAFTATTITLSLASTNAAALPGAALVMGYDDSLSIGGNLVNNGTFDLSRGNTVAVCQVTFNKVGEQTLSGTGATTRFRNIILTKGAIANKVIASINVTAAGTPLTFNAGTWEQNAGRFTGTSGSIGIGSLTATSCGLNIIGSGGMSIFSNVNVYGALLVNTTDSLIVGTGMSKIDLTYILGASATFTKGTVLVNGKITTAALTALTINGANVVVDPKAFTSTDYAFRATTGTGGVNAFTFTSGSLTILNPNPTVGGNPEFAMSASVPPIFTGTSAFILGQGANTTPSADGFGINLNSVSVLNNLIINTGTVGVTLQSNVKLSGKLTITSCGALTTTAVAPAVFAFTAPNYVFNGSTAQVTGNILKDTVSNVTINNALGVTASKQLLISDTLFLVKGTLSGPYTARVTVNVTTAVHDVAVAPRDFALNQNFPNPFNPSTNVSYQVAKAGFVSVKIYNALGQEVATLVNEVQQPGAYGAVWNAAGLGSGMYFYTMQSGSFSETRKMILMK